MIKIIHRVNTIKKLIQIPSRYGTEVDIRAAGKDLILNHEPYGSGDRLDDYLKHFHHTFIIFNIKEAGIESDVIELAKKYSVKNYFLLDVEFPYIFRATRNGIKNIAIRFSEDESIQTVEKYRGFVDWVWIDTISKIPLNKHIVKKLEGFKTCLVCPERWERAEDIPVYKKKMKLLGFEPDAVMTAEKYIPEWEK